MKNFNFNEKCNRRIAKRVTLIAVLLAMCIPEMWANQTKVFGVTLPTSNTYTVKYNIKRNNWNDNDGWVTVGTTEAGLTYEGKKLYIGSYETSDNFIQKFQLQTYDGGTQKYSKTIWNNAESGKNADHFNTIIYEWDGGSTANLYQRGSDNSIYNMSTSKLYFDASGWSETNIRVVIGHASVQKYRDMTLVPGTKLYYNNNLDSWNDAMGFGIVGGEKDGTRIGNGTQYNTWLTDVSAHAKEFTGLRHYGLNNNGDNVCYLVVNNGKAGEMPDVYYDAAYQTYLNKTQTYNTVVKVGAGSYTAANSKATINISSYELTSQGGTTNRTPSISTSANNTTVNACRTATTRLQVGTVASDYQFDGWYTAATGGELVSSSTDYTYYPTTTNTYYARFSQKAYTLTYHDNEKTGGGSAPSAETIYSGNTVKVKDNINLMTKSGKVFAGWATSQERASNGEVDYVPGVSDTFKASGNVNLYAVWKNGSYFISLTGASTNGEKNTTDFLSTQNLTNTATTVNGVTFSKSYYATASNISSSNKIKGQNDVAKYIIYDAKTTVSKVRVYMKHNSGSTTTANIYYYVAKEGVDPGDNQTYALTNGSEYVLEVNLSSTKGARFVIGTDQYQRANFTQIIATEEGKAFKEVGETGYQMSFPGRAATVKEVDYTFNGLTINSASPLKIDGGDEVFVVSGGSRFVSFTTSASTQLQVTTGNSTEKFVVCTNKSSAASTGEAYGGAKNTQYNINLTSTGTFYIIGNSASNAKIKKIAFADYVACTAPTGLAAGTITETGATLTVTDGSTRNYEFYVSTSNTAPTASTVATHDVTGSKTKELTGLAAGTTYYAWVRSVESRFNKSSWVALTGETFTTTAACSATANAGADKATTVNVGVAMAATAASSGYTGAWSIKTGSPNTSTTQLSSTSSATATFTPTAAGTYTLIWTVTENGSGGSCSASDEVDVVVSCIKPIITEESLGTSGAVTDNSATLLWDDVGRPAGTASYKIYLYNNTTSTLIQDWTPYASNTKTYDDLVAGTSYTFKVKPVSETSGYCEEGDEYSVNFETTAAPSCSAPAAPSISGTTAYTYGGTISLTATCASGTDASTTYTWYKGATWDAASESSPVQAAATGSSGYTFTKTAVMADAGTYWCEASNGETCKSHNSTGYAITVGKASISPTLTYTSTSLTTGDETGTPSVGGNTGDGAVSYEVTASSPSGCITVDDETGVVTAVAVGTGTVTATIEATDNYLGGTATANFTVNAPCFYADDLKKEKDLGFTAGSTLDASKVSGTITGGAITNSSASSSISGNDKYGLIIDDAAKKVTVTLTSPSIFQVGTVITIGAHVSNEATSGTSKTCGFTVSGKAPTPASKTSETKAETFTQTYTVVADDGIEGTNHFEIALKSSADKTYIRSIKVTGCGEAEGYSVTYANGGATSGSVPTDSNSPYEEGATVTILDKGSLAKTGYSFGGWSANVDLTIDAAVVTAGTPIAADKEFAMPAGDVTLTAVWTPNDYTITYHLNGASWAGGYSAPTEYTVGIGATLPLAGNMTNTGYTFGGWYANSDLSTGGVVTEIGTAESGNKEFWAKWTENTYTITYDKNNGSATGTTAATEGHYVTVANCGFELTNHLFTGWNTASDGSGDSYGAGEDIELTANMKLYAQWATNYNITWGNVQIGGAGVTVTPNLGGGNYTITANTGSWTGSLTADMVSTETSGVTITNVAVDNSSSPKTVTVTFAVGATVVGESIGLTLSVPAAGAYGAKESTESIDIERCTGSGGGSDGVLFSAEFKDSGLTTNNVCTAANTPYTFTTAELKSAPTGGSIKAYTTSNLSHMKFATNAISIAGSDGVIQIDLDNAIQTNDLFTYVNVNSSKSSAYLRHTTADNTTDQIALTVYSGKEVKVMLPAGYNGKKKLYLVRNNNDFNLHKAAVVRPAFLMLLRDDTPTSDTNLEGTDVKLTTSNYLTTIQGGNAYFTSPSSGNLKIKRSNSKNYINFNNAAGYVKIVLSEALQEGDVIGFDSYNTNELALTTTAERSTTIYTTSQLYTVGSSSALKGQTTFYLWQKSGTSDFLRGLQIARSGIAGGGGGTDKITPTLSWETNLSGGVSKKTSDDDFVHTASQDMNSLGAITYSSSNTAVATVNATTGEVHLEGGGTATITATIAASGCYNAASVSYVVTVKDDCEDVAGTITTEDLGCSGIKMTVTGHTAAAGVRYQWYKVGTPDVPVGSDQDNYTTTTAGSYYVIVTNTGDRHCAKRSRNTVEVAASASASATKIVDSWYVKNGRRTPDVALVQSENAESFTVKNGSSTVIWNSDGSVETGFGGCGFHMDENGIIYLNGTTAADGSGNAPSGLTGGEDETLTITVSGCGGDPVELNITIHKQASTTLKSVAFVVDGTKGGAFDADNESHSVNTALYKYLDNTASGGTGAFDLTAQNIYATTDEKAIRQHYSQFDAILITDDPGTKETPSGDYKTKGYVNAFGTMVDVRPILTMEAYVSALANWKTKGIAGEPTSPNPRQYALRLECKDHEIYKEGLPDAAPGTNVWDEVIGGETYRNVVLVDHTKSPYTGLADDEQTAGKESPALQGFDGTASGSLLGLGRISNGSLQAAIERQEEPAARLLVFSIQAKALPNALTNEGKRIIQNILTYLLKTNMEEVDDCSNYFTGKTNRDWNTPSNWSKTQLPSSEARVRILAPCEIGEGTTARVAQVEIVSSGKSSIRNTETGSADCDGELTISAGGSLIVGGKIRKAEAPHFGADELMPMDDPSKLIINTGSTAQAALIFNNDEGETQATVQMYSKATTSANTCWQYIGIPMESLRPAQNWFYNAWMMKYTTGTQTGNDELYSWEYIKTYDELNSFNGYALTQEEAKSYWLAGALAETGVRELPLSNAGGNGWNMYANSWTAPINIAALESSDFVNADATIYLYNTGSRADWDAVSGDAVSMETTAAVNTAGQYLSVPVGLAVYVGTATQIPAMQGFFVQGNHASAAGSLTLDYDKVVRTTPTEKMTTPLRAPRRAAASKTEPEHLTMIVQGSSYGDVLHLFRSDEWTDAYDNGYDAHKVYGDDYTPQLAAGSPEEELAVVATDELEGTQIRFRAGTHDSEYTIRFLYNSEDESLYLYDIQEQIYTRVETGASYTFTASDKNVHTRFVLTRNAPQIATGVGEVPSDQAQGTKAKKLLIEDKMFIMVNGMLYDATGKVVK